MGGANGLLINVRDLTLRDIVAGVANYLYRNLPFGRSVDASVLGTVSQFDISRGNQYVTQNSGCALPNQQEDFNKTVLFVGVAVTSLVAFGMFVNAVFNKCCKAQDEVRNTGAGGFAHVARLNRAQGNRVIGI